jgi:two-component system nitrogen regulation response regulator GlnG
MPRAALRASDFLVAESATMRDVVGALDAYAGDAEPVLVCGEQGTGRELVGRALHERGPRRRERFLAVGSTFEDVPAVAAGEAGSEHVRGALRAAAGGTLLVKDLSDLSASAQRTLRRAIAGESSDTLHARVVATADLDLERAVGAAIVAPALYELFRGRRIDVPPLRARLDDLPALCERWLTHYAAEIGRAKPCLSSRALARLAAYPWPGNVAELKSIARQLVVRGARLRIDAGEVDELLPTVATRVPLEELAFEEVVKAKLAGLLARVDGYPVRDLHEKVIARVERSLFDLVLAHTGGNQLRAAEILGLNRNTLRKKLVELGTRRDVARTGASRAKSSASRRRGGRTDRALDE